MKERYLTRLKRIPMELDDLLEQNHSQYLKKIGVRISRVQTMRLFAKEFRQMKDRIERAAIIIEKGIKKIK